MNGKVLIHDPIGNSKAAKIEFLNARRNESVSFQLNAGISLSFIDGEFSEIWINRSSDVAPNPLLQLNNLNFKKSNIGTIDITGWSFESYGRK
jgi:hypothetical protein